MRIFFLRQSNHRDLTRCSGVFCQKVGAYMGAWGLFSALFFSFSLCAEQAYLRVPLTSLEVVSDRVDVPSEEDEALKDDVVLELGPRSRIRANFRLSAEERKMAGELPKTPGRVGLFLRRPRNVTASVQRGTLEKCDSGFCSAIFNSNRQVVFYEEFIKNPGDWYVQILQNPALEERLLEIQEGESPPWSWYLGGDIGRNSIVLEESSSTPYNAFKQSRRTSWGGVWAANLKVQSWELLARNYTVTLDTEGFFADDFLSSVEIREYQLRWRRPIDAHSRWGLSLGMLSKRFITSNDDEAILNTKYNTLPLGAFYEFVLPWDIVTWSEGSAVLEVGQGEAGVDMGFLGSAEDTDLWKRGQSASWRFFRIYADYRVKTRAESLWYDGWYTGLRASFMFLGDTFEGEAEGPSTGLPVGTTTSGTEFQWGWYFGRGFSW